MTQDKHEEEYSGEEIWSYILRIKYDTGEYPTAVHIADRFGMGLLAASLLLVDVSDSTTAPCTSGGMRDANLGQMVEHLNKRGYFCERVVRIS